jgi:hypothetical protein
MRKLPFILMAIFLGCFFAPAANADLSDGLVAYYPFNGNANDESGNGNDASYCGAILTQDRFGKPNGAYQFNGGNSDYIEIPNSPFLNLSTYTVTCWVKLDAADQNQPILDKRNGQHHRNYGIFYYANDPPPIDNLAAIIGDSSFAPTNYSNAAYSSVALNNGDFYFIAVTYDQTSLVLYLNGSPLNTKTITMPNITGMGNLYIGSHGSVDQGFLGRLTGVIDEVRILITGLAKTGHARTSKI